MNKRGELGVLAIAIIVLSAISVIIIAESKLSGLAINFEAQDTSILNDFETEAAPLSTCKTTGWVANTIYVLTDDVGSVGFPGQCFNINANNVTLDCRGHTINYSQSGTGIGIYSSYVNFTKVLNCNLVYGIAASGGSRAILFEIANNITIQNNVVRTNNSNNPGIELDAVSFANIINNTVITNGTSSNGIYLVSSSKNNITSNNVTTLANGGNGIELESSSVSNILKNNIFTTRGDSANGIYFESGPAYNTVTNNTINILGNLSIGIRFLTSSNSNLSNNVITTNEIYSNNYGIQFYGGSNSNIAINNTITTKGVYGYGILLEAGSNSNIALNNTITTVGNISYGIYNLNSNSNNITNGVIITNGSGSCGIVSAYSNYTNITSNNITTSGTSSSGICLGEASNSTMIGNILSTTGAGVSFDTHCYSNSIENNIIVSSSFGVRIYSSSDYNKIKNNTITTSGGDSCGIQLVTDVKYTNLTGNNIKTYDVNSYGILINAASHYSNLINNTVYSNQSWDLDTVDSNGIVVTNLYLNRANISFTGKDISLKSVSNPHADTSDMMRNIGKYLNITNNTASSWIYLNVSYDPSQLGSVIEPTMKLYRFDGTDWVNTSINPNGDHTVIYNSWTNTSQVDWNAWTAKKNVETTTSVGDVKMLPESTAPYGTDIVLGVVPTTSWEDNPGRATDGDENSAWQSNPNVNYISQYATLDLGANRYVRRIRLKGGNVINYEEPVLLRYSTNGADWITATSIPKPQNGYWITKTYDYTPFLARYVQVYINRDTYNDTVLVIYSINVYEAYPPTGGMISPKTNLSKINNNNITAWGTFGSFADLNGQTLDYYIRSATNDTNLDSATWHAIIPGTLITEPVANNWIQTRVNFSSDGTNTPVLHDITVSFANGAIDYYVYGNTSNFTGGIFAPMGESTALNLCKNNNWLENTTYTLESSVTSPGTCMQFNVNNVTLDCRGRYIQYSMGQQGNAINISGYNFTTVKNCNLNQLGGTYNTWTNTSQTDWNAWTNTNVDTSTSNGDVKIAPESLAVQQTTVNTAPQAHDGYWNAQSFRLSNSNRLISKISLMCSKEQNPSGPVYLDIRTDDGGKPSNTILGTSNPLEASNLPSMPFTWVDFTFPNGIFPSSSTTYWLVLRFPGGIEEDFDNIIRWWYATSNVYADGQFSWRNPSQVWYSFGGDSAFKIYTIIPSAGIISPKTNLSTFSSDDITSWNTFESSADVPAQTSLNYYIRSATNSTNLNSATWHAISPSSIITEPLVNKWIQTMVNFSTYDPAATPVLHDVKVNFITGSNALSNSHAVFLKSAYNNTIQNSTITTVGSGSHGARLTASSAYNNLINNTITTSGTGGQGLLLESSTNSAISGNKITTSGNNAYGAQLTISANSNTLTDNSFKTTGAGSYGLYLTFDSNLNNFMNNVVKTSSIDFVSSGAGTGNTVSSITFNSSSWPAKVGFTYSGDIQVNSTTPKFDSQKNISKYIEIKNQTAATMTLNMFYNDPSDLGSASESSLRLFRHNGTDFLRISDSGVNTASNYVYGNAPSAFGVFAPLETPSTSISSCQDLTLPYETYLLTQNVNSSGRCFNILANGVTLDCQGHTINYSQISSENGIEIVGRDSTTIKNCNIMQGSDVMVYPISLESATNSVITQNTIISKDDSIVAVLGSNLNEISDNNIDSSASRGIYISGLNNTLSGNTIISYSPGIYLTESNNTQVMNNDINGIYGGIFLEVSSNSNTLSDNTIITTEGGTSGITLQGGSENNVLNKNTITGYGSNSLGVLISPFCNSNNLTNNIITTDSFSIRIYSNSNNIINNTVSNILNYEFYSNAGSQNNTVINLILDSAAISFDSEAVGVMDTLAPIDDPSDVKRIDKFVNIVNTSSISWAYVKFLYSDADIANFNESTLRVYGYNGSNYGANWTMLNETLNQTGVNEAENYVYANLSVEYFENFSVIGAFGVYTPQSIVEQGGGGTGRAKKVSGGGGGGVPVVTVPITTAPAEIKIEENPQLQSEWTSGQAVSVSTSSGGTITFNVNSESHLIEVKSINTTTGVVEVWIYSEPIAVSLMIGETREVDVNSDGINDISVTLNGITNGKADLSIINLAAAGAICGNNVCEEGENSDSCCVDCSCSSGFECQIQQATFAAGAPAPPAYRCVQVQIKSTFSNLLPILLVIVAMILWIAIALPILMTKKGKAKSALLIEAEIKRTYKLLEGKMVDEAAKEYELLKKYYKDYADNIPPAKRRKLYTQILKLYNAITSHYK